MDLKAQLLKEHSKENSNKIAAYIGKNPDRFSKLFDLLINSEYRVSQRSAMALAKCTDLYPELIIPHMDKFIHNLNEDISDAVKRNTVRTLQTLDIPDHLLGIATDTLFRIMENRKEPIAIKVFTMTVLARICEKEPELANELKLLIEDQIPYGSTGFKNRGGKTIKKLEKLILKNR